MTIEIRQFPCLQDNYGFLVRDCASREVASIDAPDAEVILAELDQAEWRLSYVLTTHWHSDHAGGNAALKAATGACIVGPEEIRRKSPIDRIVGEGDAFALGHTKFQVMDTGGHTLQHISYHAPAEGVVFVGDTLFALGCGRLFEGTAEQMWRSLSKLAALPAETAVYCAHEYTAANAHFALSVDAAPAVAARAADVFARRAEGRPTIPTTMELEIATNPFLRAQLLRPALEGPEAFAELRSLKDSFQAPRDDTQTNAESADAARIGRGIDRRDRRGGD